MGRTLIVAEKPSVARDIARVLGVSGRGEGCITGKDWCITWAIGHLVALCDPGEMEPAWQRWSRETLPMLPREMKTKVLPDTQKQFKTVAALMNADDTDRLVCATDSGREGELIFRLIYDKAGCTKPFDRLWVNSMTDEAVREGFAKLRPGADYDALYRSALCRSEADWLVGMNASRAFSLRYDVVLSVGRVQTPTLAILVRRQREIEDFKPVEYWEVTVDLGDFTALWYDPQGDTTRIGSEEQAKAITARVKGGRAAVEKIAREQKQNPAPQLYDLTSLQRDANSYFGFSAARTLKAAQSLYETYKLLTYPRTDSRYLPVDMRGRARGALASLKGEYAPLAAPVAAGELPLLPRVFNNDKVTDHHALIVTDRTPPPNLPEDERRIYDLVARRLIAAFYPPYKYDSVSVITGCRGERFITRGTLVSDEGWRAVYASLGKQDKQSAPLPNVHEGDERDIKKAQSRKKATKPPTPHTEATLLSAMEHADREVDDPSLRESMRQSGLGTPATRAAIIERLIQVGYVARRGRALEPTEKGRRLIDVVPKEMSSPETTGRWERALKSIAEGRMDRERFMASIARYTAFLVGYAATGAPAGVKFPEDMYRSKRAGAKRAPAQKATKTAASGKKEKEP